MKKPIETVRQEIEITFDGKTYKVRPEFALIGQIEATLDQASQPLGMKFLQIKVSVLEVATVMQAILEHQGDKRTFEQVGQTLMDDGYEGLLLPIGQLLTRAMRGNKEHEKEAAKGASGDPQTAQEG